MEQVYLICVVPILVIALFAVRGFRGGVPKDAVKLATIASGYALEALLRALTAAEIKYFLKHSGERGVGKIVHIQPSYGEVSVYVSSKDFAAATSILIGLNNG